MLEALIGRGKKADELLPGIARTGYDFSAAKTEIEDLKQEQIKKYEEYVRGTASREEFMEAQATVKEKIAVLEGQLALAKKADDHTEEVEDALKPLADAGVEASKKGLTRHMVEALVEAVWVGDEIEVRFRADGVMETLAG